jgi:hypothetical protein
MSNTDKRMKTTVKWYKGKIISASYALRICRKPWNHQSVRIAHLSPKSGV